MAKSTAKYTLLPDADEGDALLRAPDTPGDDSGDQDEGEGEGAGAGSAAGRDEGKTAGQRHLLPASGPALQADAARGVETLIPNYLSVQTAAVCILMTHPALLVPAFSSLPAPSPTV
jgi:hypothetical protein